MSETGKMRCAGLIGFVAAAIFLSSAFCSVFETSAASKPVFFKNVSSGTVLRTGGKLKIHYGTSPKYRGKAIGFKSSNKRIATVSRKGVIRGKKKGKVRITIYVKKKKSVRATVTIHVKRASRKVKSIRITGDRALVKGTSVRLKAKVSPGTARNKKVKWRSSNKSVVKVSSAGKLTGVSAGTARVTATAKDGSGVSRTVTVQVVNLDTSFTRFIAHRGYHVDEKENTAAAFEAAGDQGFWGCECDVWETAKNDDDEFDIVISHDNSFRRVFGYIGKKTYEMTAEEIRSSVPEACFLDEYLDICKEKGMVPAIEIKYDYGNSAGMSDKGIREVLNKVNEAGLLDRARFISFHPPTLVRLKNAAASEYNMEPYTAYLMSDGWLKRNQNSSKPDYAKAIKTAASKGFSAVSIIKTALTKSRAALCRSKGLQVDVWTFNKGDSNLVYKQVKTLGADSITTNAKFW